MAKSATVSLCIFGSKGRARHRDAAECVLSRVTGWLFTTGKRPLLDGPTFYMTRARLSSSEQWYSTFLFSYGTVVVKALCYRPEGRGFET
jgi:hypothetical protein